MSKVIIFGAQGQDGRCLSELLLQRGCEVTCIARDSSVDIHHPEAVAHLIKTVQPDEIYFLAAFHHSSEQKTDAELQLWDQSIQTHLSAPAILLESVRLHAPRARVFYAASSLIFGAGTGVLNEDSALAPDSPYAITKAAGMALCQYYREKHQLLVSVGILFNHESEYRAAKFLSKKITRAVAAIQRGSSERLRLGSLSAQVDWGYARDYVEAMTRILKQETAGNFVISSGQLHSVKQFVEIAFSKAGLESRDHVEEDPSLLQRNIPSRLGDYSKLRTQTGWTPTTSFDKLIEILLISEGVKLVSEYKNE